MNRNIACVGLFATLVLIGLSIGFAKPNIGQSGDSDPFRATIRVFAGSATTPITEHVILFDHDLIYALPSSDGEQVTVIDEASKRVTLLDRGSQTRTSISFADLLRLTAHLRASASTEERRQRLGIDAKVQVDEQSGIYSVTYGGIQYSTTTEKPESPVMAVLFGRFSDWASRLNIARQLGMPPFGRMLMNSQIAADGRIPLETELQVQRGTSTISYRSTHEVNPQLTASDRDRIHEVAGMMTLYKQIPFADFAD